MRAIGSDPMDERPFAIVNLVLREPVRGRSAGVAVTIRTLGLGLEDPEGFLASVSARV